MMALEADIAFSYPYYYYSSYTTNTSNLYDDNEEMDIEPAGRIPLSSSPENNYFNNGGGGGGDDEGLGFAPVTEEAAGRIRRRRRRKGRGATAVKNDGEVENQRMTHIAVERNRRKQMNQYLAVLRSMMPPSYAHRGDQASIVGGAINFVKELEQLLHSLEAHKHNNYTSSSSFSSAKNNNNNNNNTVVSDFFTFPQYSTTTTTSARPSYNHNPPIIMPEKSSDAVADVEVSMVDGHANIKVLSRKQPKHLLNMVVAMQSLCLNILHLNVTTFGHMVLYSFSVKVDENCELSSVNEIAAAVYEMVERIQEENCHVGN